MKISIITVTYNAARFLEESILSVLQQSYRPLEFILIDGGSQDGTLEIAYKYKEHFAKLISEPDQGLYDAMNKGIAHASGDIIGFLHAGDVYADKEVLQRVGDTFLDTGCDTTYGNLVYIQEDPPHNTVRIYNADKFRPGQMRMGMMPPHPTFFVRRKLYELYGKFDTSYAICADFELMLRLFVVHKVSYRFIPHTLVKMRVGGISTGGLKSTIRINKEMLRACRSQGIRTHLLLIYAKYPIKIFQLWVLFRKK